MMRFDRPKDGELVRRALNKDPDAFERLILRWQGRAIAVALAAGAGSHGAEDAAQEAILRAFRGLADLRDPRSFGPWFLSIVRNLARTQMRRERTGPPPEVKANVDTSPGDKLELKELQERVWQGMEKLPEGVREAICLYYFEGQSVRRVGRALGIGREAAKSRIRRGREMLRERLWRDLAEGIRSRIPNAQDRKLAARRLSLIVISELPDSWSRRGGKAKLPAPAGMEGSTGILLKAGAILAASAIVVGSAALLVHGPPGREPRRPSERSLVASGRPRSPSPRPGSVPAATIDSEPRPEEGGPKPGPDSAGEPLPPGSAIPRPADTGPVDRGTHSPSFAVGLSSGLGGSVSSGGGGAAFMGWVPDRMLEGGQMVKGFTVLARSALLKSVVVQSGGDFLSETYRFAEGQGVWSVVVPLDRDAEITASRGSRDAKISVDVHTPNAWHVAIVPLADREGKEFYEAVLEPPGASVGFTSPRATGVMARFTNDSMEPLEALRISFDNLDPSLPEPEIRGVEDRDGVFGKVEHRGNLITLRGGAVAYQQTFWLDVSFDGEVGGEIGAAVTVLPLHR